MKKSIKIGNSTGEKKCQICGNKDILEVHHIEGRDIPNANHSSNLVAICSSCHTKIHFGKIIVEGWFMTTGGKSLIWHKEGEASFTNSDGKPHLFKNS